MTERLYYTDAYAASFQACVVDRSDDGRRVYLDHSAFYPTSGGQLHDLGSLNGVAVLEVVDEDDRVAHILERALPEGDKVEGIIDWRRRFDFMQQHTGQHLLSAMFEDRYKWPTVSVHFGVESATLDVNASNFDATKLIEAERVANEIVVANREVTVSFEESATVTGLRKPSERAGTLRVVTIAEVDRSACGGTHVKHTGEIGSILLRRAERTKGQVRIEFLCGQRAVRAARRDADLLSRAAQVFTAAVEDVPRLVEAQQQQLKDLEREYRKLNADLAGYDARKHWDAATPDANGLRRVQISFDGGAVKDREALAQAIVALGGAAVVITSRSPVGVMLATSADSNVDAGAMIRAAVSPLGGRGGGSPRLAQASLPSADLLAQVRTALGF
ncbi:MAG: alanyl-tRNA editing protein [Gemmatimonadaceae bacterium]